MSNVMRVNITGIAPFNFLDNMADSDAAKWARFVFAPTTGLNMTFTPATSQRNSDGGLTARYFFSLTGEEAVSEDALSSLLVSVTQQEFGEVDTFSVVEPY